jgi:Zn-dependent peptidase ImmA (M78 family)
MSMDKRQYYARMRELARKKRQEYSVDTSAFGVREVRSIYRMENITVDIRKLPSCLKAIYVLTDEGASVAVRKDLPDQPKIFALVHELKHHWVDHDLIRTDPFTCGDYNANELQEKGAEVFAAEFIYPEQEFLDDIGACNGTTWTAEDIVRFRREHCRAKVSFTFIRKRLERAGLILPDQFVGIKFQKLEEEMYGVPFYRQPWFRGRQRKVPLG